jgi:hypothetical protein
MGCRLKFNDAGAHVSKDHAAETFTAKEARE